MIAEHFDEYEVESLLPGNSDGLHEALKRQSFKTTTLAERMCGSMHIAFIVFTEAQEDQEGF